jgi:hypothetical protein
MVMPCKESVAGQVTNWLAESVNMQFSTAQWLWTRSGLANLFEARDQIVKFEEILSRAHGNFEEENKVLSLP